MKEILGHKTVWRIRKFKNSSARKRNEPYEICIIKGNLTLNEGANLFWKIIAGEKPGADNFFDNTNSFLGVGDDDTAAQQTDTDLIGSASYIGMLAGYPQVGTDRKIVFKSIFDEDHANFNWKEFCVTNFSHGSGTDGTVFNRKVENKGIKLSGEQWELTLTLSIS